MGDSTLVPPGELKRELLYDPTIPRTGVPLKEMKQVCARDSCFPTMATNHSSESEGVWASPVTLPGHLTLTYTEQWFSTCGWDPSEVKQP